MKKKENLKVVSSEFDQALKKSLIKTKNKINSLAKIISEKNTNLINRPHESERVFSSYLELGKIDAIKLYSPQCKTLQDTTLYIESSSFCEYTKDKKSTWENEESYPLLSYTKSLSAQGKEYLLQGQLFINQSWLNIYPKLKEKMEQQGIFFAATGSQHESFLHLIHEAKVEGEQARIFLGTNDYLDSYLHYFFAKNERLSSKHLNFVALIIICLLLMILIFSKYTDKEERNLFDDFDQWINNTKNLSHKDLYNLCLNVIQKSEHHTSLYFTKAVSQLMCNILDKTVRAQSQLEQTQAQLAESNKKILQLEEKISLTPTIEPLAYEVQQLAPQLIDILNSHSADLEESHYILQQSSLNNCQIVLSHLDEWKKEVKNSATVNT